MPLPLVPVAIGILTGAAFLKAKGKPAPLSEKTQAERAIIYETLINDVKDPAVLRRFSDAFREQGAMAEAEMLLKRAMLRELPPEVKKQRNEAFKKGMKSKDPKAVRTLADAFEQTGATGAAGALRDYALALERSPESEVGPANPHPGQDESNPGIGNEGTES